MHFLTGMDDPWVMVNLLLFQPLPSGERGSAVHPEPLTQSSAESS